MADRITNANELLESVAQAARVREGAEGVRAIYRAIREGDTVTTRAIARAVRLPLPVVAAVKGELASHGLLERRPSGVGLTERGCALADDLFGARASDDADVSRTQECVPAAADGPAERTRAFSSRLEAIAAGRPDVDVALDQSRATPDTLARRVAYLDRNDAIAGRRILCLGDDDFVSAAIGEWVRSEGERGRSMRPQTLLALDVDPRIAERLAAVGVDTLVADVRDPLPPELCGQFDVVVTDPPYTLPGAEVFLSRAVEAVGGRKGARCFLSFGHLDPSSMRHVQSALAEMGWVVIEWLPGFNEYEGAGVLANKSLLAQLVLADEACPAIEGRYDGSLYTADVRPTASTYRCTGCGARWEVGPGMRWQTVAELKRRTCPQCGHDRFRRVGQRRLTTGT